MRYILKIYHCEKSKKQESTLSRTVRGHFLRKNFFLVFCLGQLRGLPNNIRHSSRKKTKRSCEVWPSGGDKVEFVEAEGRRKVEGLRKISRRRKEKLFLGCSVVWNSVPGLYWSLFSLLRRFWALFLEFFGLRWALHSRSLFAARWFLGSIKLWLWHFPETLQVRPCQS